MKSYKIGLQKAKRVNTAPTLSYVLRQYLKNFSDNDNSIWVLRHYLAIKLIISASIMSGSAIYARRHNLLIGVPYFNYYTLLNCCRAFLMTSPDIIWDGGDTLSMSHSKIINLTGDLMKRLDRSPDRRWTERLQESREHRELYSYRFPASGAGFVDDVAFDTGETTRFARLIAELAMLNSECFDASLKKHAPSKMNIPPLQDHDWATAYNMLGVKREDRYDRERFGKLVYGWGRVSTLEVMTSDRMIEDFYGAWCCENPDGTLFDPDDFMGHILKL